MRISEQTFIWINKYDIIIKLPPLERYRKAPKVRTSGPFAVLFMNTSHHFACLHYDICIFLLQYTLLIF